jgi:transposase InsO family protein
LWAERINQVWSYDFVWDQTEQGRRLKWLPMLDEHTRECLALEVEYSITASAVIDILERLVHERGAPEFIRSDNGPEFIAQAIKDWIAEKGMKPLYIEPGSPWENPYSESFNSRLRDEFLNVELLRQQAGGESAGPRATREIQPTSAALLTGGFDPGGVRRTLSCSAPAFRLRRSGLRSARQCHQPETPTKSLIATGSNFGGTPSAHFPKHRSFKFLPNRADQKKRDRPCKERSL